MKQKQLLQILTAMCFVMLILFAPQGVRAEAPFEGSGTERDPYLIADYEDLCKLSELTQYDPDQREYNETYIGAYYLQTADITANTGTFALNGSVPTYNGTKVTYEMDEEGYLQITPELKQWRAIDFFNGRYDGNGYSISGLFTCSEHGDSALFRVTGEGELRNISVRNSLFISIGWNASGITCTANGTTITNCDFDGIVIGGSNLGGIAGEAARKAQISECTNKGTILHETDSEKTRRIGGICGTVQGSTIEQCENRGTVVGDSNVGGIAGATKDDPGKPSSIDNCTNSGTVTGVSHVGGIIGYSQGIVNRCVNKGNISGSAYIGGICGSALHNDIPEEEGIFCCVNNGTVTYQHTESNMMDPSCGGISGTLSSKAMIIGCINNGSINGKDIEISGGICGAASGVITQCINYGTVTSNRVASGILGKGKDTAVVIYCANRGNISSKRSFAGGILGDVFTGRDSYFSRDYLDENYVITCYNTGTVTSDTPYAGAIAGAQIYETVSDCYYLNNAAKGIGIDNDNSGETFSMTEAQMKNRSFVAELNRYENAFKYDDLNENDGYPMPLAASQMPFTDVPANEYYFDAVLWAVENGVTNGMNDGTFGSNLSCTRAQFVTFLWRAAGCPEASADSCDFKDCGKDQYYYPAVIWAVENGVTDGTSATTFSPDKTVNRAEVITFLWKYAGKPAVSDTEPFTDVTDDDWFSTAVRWGYANGLAKGVSDNLYGSMQNCTRAQTATFLYRNFQQ